MSGRRWQRIRGQNIDVSIISEVCIFGLISESVMIQVHVGPLLLPTNRSAELQPLSTLHTPNTNNTSSDQSNASQQLGPSFSSTTSKSIKRLLGQLMLSKSHTKEVVGDTSSEQKWGYEGGERCCDCCKDFDEGVGGYTGVETGRVVVE
jgi:hypothetical protein